MGDVMAQMEAESRQVKLGSAFWTLWIVGFIVLIGLYLAAMQWNMAQEKWSTALAIVATILFTCAVWLLSMTPYILKRRLGERERIRLPMRRYMMRIMPASLLYVIVFSLAGEFHREASPTGWVVWVLAVASCIPVLYLIRAILLYLKEEDDEFQRDLQLRAFVLATGLSLALCTVWGFLEIFSLAPHIQPWAVFPLWAVCLIPAQLAVRWKWR
jgi:hypothetical protein